MLIAINFNEHEMLDFVTNCAVAAGIACLLLYFVEAILSLYRTPASDAKQALASAKGMSPISAADASKLLEAISKLTDSLAKAGPALTSLVGAVLFFTIAAVSAGAIRGTPPTDQKGGGKVQAGASAENGSAGSEKH